MAAATSGACVSGAKCLVSKKRTVAFAMSRLNTSALAGRKNGSFLPPQCRQQGRRMGPEILLEGRIERDVALIVGHVELHLGMREARPVAGEVSANRRGWAPAVA